MFPIWCIFIRYIFHLASQRIIALVAVDKCCSGTDTSFIASGALATVLISNFRSGKRNLSSKTDFKIVVHFICTSRGNYFSVSLTFYYKFIIFHRCLTSITFAVFGNIIDRKCQLPVTDRLVRMVRHSKIILEPILIFLTFRKRDLHFSVIRGKTFTVFRYYFFRRPWTKSCHQSKYQNTRPYFSYFLFHFPYRYPGRG